MIPRNTGRILKPRDEGAIRKTFVGDLAMLEEGSLEIVHGVSQGKMMVRDGTLACQETCW